MSEEPEQRLINLREGVMPMDLAPGDVTKWMGDWYVYPPNGQMTYCDPEGFAVSVAYGHVSIRPKRPDPMFTPWKIVRGRWA